MIGLDDFLATFWVSRATPFASGATGWVAAVMLCSGNCRMLVLRLGRPRTRQLRAHFRSMATRSYEEAIACLNSLQSNAAEIAAAAALPVAQRPSKKLDLVREYLDRMGYSVGNASIAAFMVQFTPIQPDQLNSLNVIHVTGTKGKGSTCALADSILRATNPNWQIGISPASWLLVISQLSLRPLHFPPSYRC
jgi:hypothetical protein